MRGIEKVERSKIRGETGVLRALRSDPKRESAARREKFRRSSDLVKFLRIDHRP